LSAATATVAALPELRFVLDHIAKPRIAEGHDELWRARLPALAARPNVGVKLSGLVTEADWANWTAEDLRPFVRFVVDRFRRGARDVRLRLAGLPAGRLPTGRCPPDWPTHWAR